MFLSVEGMHAVVRLAHIHHPLKFSSLRGNIHSTRSNLERILQLKTGCVKPNNDNMDCRVAPASRNDTQLVSSSTSPNLYPPTPFGYFPRKGGRSGGAQLAHIHHPLKFSSLRGSSHSARSNLERILQLKTGCVEPNNDNMDCHVASAPRNDTPLVVLPTSPNLYPRNDAQPVSSLTNQNIYPRNFIKLVVPTYQSKYIYPPP